MEKTTEVANNAPVLLNATYKLIISNGLGKSFIFNKDTLCTAMKVIGSSAKAALWTFVILSAGGTILALRGIPYEDILVLLSNIRFNAN